MSPAAQDVRHNPEASRFELETPAGLAVADYRLAGDIMSIYHTQVPAPLRGNGIGEQLVLGALLQAREFNLKVIPHCWFVRDVMDRHAEFEDLRR
jgi:predicted GNAT family acetyltransferase